MILYEIALQVVPVLMITLFLDTRTASDSPVGPGRWARLQNRLYVILCVSAFAVSLFVVAGILGQGQITQALVIGALMGCTILLAAPAWRRFGARPVERGH